MPEPVSLYQGPFVFAMSMPAASRRAASAASVPLLSPRETNGAFSSSIFFSAASMPSPFTCAGSLFGPTSTKSLYMTSKRLTPQPSARNFSSAALSCTNSTSASPRRPMSSAWPVPTATTCTSMPVAFVKAGSRCLKRPDCSVEVVEATVMKSFARERGGDRPRRGRSRRRRRRRGAGRSCLGVPWQFSFEELRGPLRTRVAAKKRSAEVCSTSLPS